MADDIAEAAQGAWNALERGVNKLWREEQEQWHDEDVQWHHEEHKWNDQVRECWQQEHVFRRLVYRCRDEDMVQRNLENARSLWVRFVERNRRDVEEKSEQLRAISNLAAIFAGFAVVSLSQFYPQEPFSLVLNGVYSVLTAVVEGLLTLSIAICTLLLLSIIKVGKSYVNEQAEEEFIFQCLEFCKSYQEGNRPPCPRKSMDAFWECRCESSWQIAFFSFSSGVSLFILSMVFIGWLKFSGQSKLTASLFVFVTAFTVLIWCFVHLAWSTYVKKMKIKYERSDRNEELLGLPYDWYLAPSFRSTY